MTEEELTAIENAANDFGVVGKEHVLKLVTAYRELRDAPPKRYVEKPSTAVFLLDQAEAGRDKSVLHDAAIQWLTRPDTRVTVHRPTRREEMYRALEDLKNAQMRAMVDGLKIDRGPDGVSLRAMAHPNWDDTADD